MTDRAAVDRWLDAYVETWKSYDREAIAALFAEEVVYRYRPHGDEIRGRDAVVRSWIEDDPDEAGTFEAEYRAVAVEGEVAVAVGTSTYLSEPGGPVDKVYDNCFVLRFDKEGRCREFTEFFMKRPAGADA